jgi:YHS domain-containing protein
MKNIHYVNTWSVTGVRQILIAVFFSLVILPAAGTSVARSAELVNALDNGVAMDGFDVVAYHTAGAPIKGSASHSVEYRGRTWLFSSSDNALAFAANPARYEPQNNGWCSYAVSEGYGAEVDFVNGWVVLDGKLYLNWDAETRDLFVAEQSSRIPKAEKNWPSVHAGLQDGSVDLYTHAAEGVDIAHPQQLE